MAYHFEAAGLIEAAVGYLLRAGQQAYRLSAPTESVTLYQRGLALLEEFPASEQRDRYKLELLLSQETPLIATRGWGAPERAETLQGAYRLGQQLGETQRLLPVLQALVSVHIARAEHHAALGYAKRLLTLAETTANGLYIGIGKRMLGTAHFFLGHYTEARACLEAGLHIYTALASEIEASNYVLAAEEGVRLRVWLPHVLLALGYPTQAEAFSQEALACAQALGYNGARAIALTTAGAIFHAIGRHPHATRRYAEELLALATKNALPSYQGWGDVLLRVGGRDRRGSRRPDW